MVSAMARHASAVATRMIVDISGELSLIRVARGLDPLQAARADAGRLERADAPAGRADPALLVGEDLLRADDVALHAGDLGDRHDAARAVGEALELNDQVDRTRHRLV